jgi:hypothetical protein
MLVDKPGLKFLANKALLQQTHTIDKLSKASNVGKEALSIAKNTVIDTTKIALSTLAQVPVNGTGTHFVEGFRTNTYLQPVGGNTRSQFAQFFGAGGIHGAEYAIRGAEVPGEHPTELTDKYSKYDYDEYLNVPTGSIGAVNLKRTTKADVGGKPVELSNIGTTLGDNGNLDLEKIYSNTQETSYTGHISEDNIGNVTTNNTVPTGGTIPTNNISHKYNSIQDANTAAKNTHTSQPRNTLSTNYTDINSYVSESKNRTIGSTTKNVVRESRVGLGDQGARSDSNKSKNVYWKTSGTGREFDKLNKQDISKDLLDGTDTVRDFAKLYFEVITPDESRFLYFRAYIDSFDDGYTGTWNGHKYVGRAENFYTYGGFDRDINLSFKIAPATRAELKPLYKKMVYLASSTAPTYGPSGLMRGTLAKMTVGSYLSQTPGVITSVKFGLVDGTPWEIAMQQPEGVEKDVQVLPMVIQCSISFKPIHTFAPQTGLYHYITNPDPRVSFFTQGAKL